MWVTQNWLGDHTDPYSYLASWGISKVQLQHDLFNGLTENGTTNPTKPAPTKPQTGQRVAMSGVFTTNQSLPVSRHTTVDSAALAWYDPYESIVYDSYVQSANYVRISYIDYGDSRRYVAVGPDDGQIDTTLGRGFFN
ncbi:hypothetical protein BCR24_06250 [Enterococcus ureilyticus]|uniref:SH3b domain-containing protein n=2 Tax=Enterococcus ureilyticus TaxID=1131292 RepID=A0A1E5HAF6_9ENTE|nr:hypothetical protein [Enterococcus ureilyticus]OEG21883.1 hypothetical protein BCR24_06250 [Enterococcus ureilyticus]